MSWHTRICKIYADYIASIGYLQTVREYIDQEGRSFIAGLKFLTLKASYTRLSALAKLFSKILRIK